MNYLGENIWENHLGENRIIFGKIELGKKNIFFGTKKFYSVYFYFIQR
jgi:hypothetical protein